MSQRRMVLANLRDKFLNVVGLHVAQLQFAEAGFQIVAIVNVSLIIFVRRWPTITFYSRQVKVLDETDHGRS